MENSTLIQLDNISKNYIVGSSEIEVLKGLDLKLLKGQSIAITGESGVGKSTLLNIIGTIDKPDSGKYTFLDNDVLSLKDENLASFRNKNIGFVFQAMYLLQEFTALENVIIPALISNVRKSEAEEMALKILSDFGLENRKNHKPSQLSGGERQRIAIARALMNKPLLILADEPTGNLDEKNASTVLEILLKLNRSYNLALILVTHNNHLAKMMDIVYRLDNRQLKRLSQDYV